MTAEGPKTTWRANGGVRDVRRARELVARGVGDQQETTRDAAVLLVDECVANAVRHGGGRFELTITRCMDMLRVEVADRAASAPRRLDLGLESESGRGLAIVDMLASRWGSHPIEPSGKVVWFELNLD
ncbi:MAG TPA: ATP-binding protein [Acidimicrobiales bacterium]|nr:ATP-binding protein [Acidimicrobiales bacterium]